MREHYPAGITGWKAVTPNMAHQVTFFARAPITIELELVTKYAMKGPGHTPPGDTTHKRTRPINPADGVRDVAGFGQEVAKGGSVECVYQIRSDDEDAGPYLIGTVQERLRNRYTTGLGVEPDTGWMPLAPSPTFFMDFGRIYDQHAANTQYWNQVPTPGVIAIATQDLRIRWQDPWGNFHEQPLGTQQIVHRKVSPTTWQVTH